MNVLTRVNTKVDILSETTSTDKGMPTGRWYVSAQSVPALVQQASGQQAVAAGGERGVRSGKAVFFGDVSISRANRIKWGSRTLQVLTVNEVGIAHNRTARKTVEWEEVDGAA